MTNINTSFLELLNRSAKPLADFLWEYLPKIDKDDWWDCLVLENLPDFVKRGINIQSGSLYELDIAALLKVFDANWHSISEMANLEFIIRNYIKETQTIRNQWAHQTADGIPDDIIERHLSTLYLLCKGIGTDSAFLDEINSARNSILSKELGNESAVYPGAGNSEPKIQKPEVSNIIIPVGTLVRLKTNPAQLGVVMGVSTSGSEPRYTIFINSKTQQFYQSQIEIADAGESTKSVSLEEFNAYLTLTQINNPNSQVLYSLNSAKIDLIPHQFRPVLKFIKSDRPRLLIADGVGVGKTIEAGLILKELEARNNARSVLIICPKPLVSERKWEEEMKLRFDERFTPLTGDELKQTIKDAEYSGEWDMEEHGKIIIPYSLLTDDKLNQSKSNSGLLNLETPPKFDLVIVDEAHHIRNSSTNAYKGVKFFVDNAEAVVFLTATPIQIGTEDLFTLLNLLRPDLISDRDIFNLMSEPNSFINTAISEIRSHKENWMENVKTELLLAEKTSWGEMIYSTNPVFVKVMEMLEKPSLTDEERVNLLTDTESLHTFSSLLNRTRRRDIGEYAVRKTVTVYTPFTPEQKAVYDEILEIQADILSKINPDTPVGFMMSTLQRRAASCLPGIIPYLKGILSCHLDEYYFSESDCYSDNREADFSSITARIDAILDAASHLPETDSKYEKMLEVLREKQSQSPNKVMIFSTFRHTLSYLAERMFDDGYRVGIIHGGIADEDRRYLRERFNLPKEDESALDVLLFSEVGCEGLDYQFCDCMINYDLPWNPMKIEQRIGRIDRTGQKSEYVSIFNLITPDTVDAEIYDRCLMRIGVFNKSIGDSEEILGELVKGITEIAENFKLTDCEKRDKISQLADNSIRKCIEEEKLAGERAELFGLNIPKMQMEKEIKDATSFWLSPESLENLLCVYLQKRFTSDNEFIVGDKTSRKLRLNAENRAILLEDFRKLSYKPEYKSWKKWLEGRDAEHSAYYPVYFSSEAAVNSNGDLITPVHPLVKQAISYLKLDTVVSTRVTVSDSAVPPGEYPFAVYLWDYMGVLKNEVMRPVCENPIVADKLFDYVREGISDSLEIVPDSGMIDKLDNVHHMVWEGEYTEHKRKTAEFIRYRKESLKRSYDARLATISDQLDSASNEHIIRMKKDELKNVKAEYAKRVRELEESESQAELISNPVGYGIVVVRGE